MAAMMKRPFTSIRCLAALGVLLTLGLVGVPQAGAVEEATARPGGGDTLKLNYDVYLGGLNVFAFDAALAVDGDDYVISGGGATKGVAKMIWKWAVEATARGTVGEGGVRAHIYNLAITRKEKNKYMRLAFRDGGNFAIHRTPPDSPRKRKRRDLPDAVPPGTLDPVSVALALGGALARGESCGGTFPVFDGNRRFNLTFTELGEERLSIPGFLAYRGRAVRCRFAMERISGFRRKHVKMRFAEGKGLQPPEVWLARLNDRLPLIPVQFRADFNLGYMLIYIKSAEYRGRKLLTAPAKASK